MYNKAISYQICFCPHPILEPFCSKLSLGPFAHSQNRICVQVRAQKLGMLIGSVANRPKPNKFNLLGSSEALAVGFHFAARFLLFALYAL